MAGMKRLFIASLVSIFMHNTYAMNNSCWAWPKSPFDIEKDAKKKKEKYKKYCDECPSNGQFKWHEKTFYPCWVRFCQQKAKEHEEFARILHEFSTYNQ
jgi:hypothetical protein